MINNNQISEERKRINRGEEQTIARIVCAMRSESTDSVRFTAYQ